MNRCRRDSEWALWACTMRAGTTGKGRELKASTRGEADKGNSEIEKIVGRGI